MSKTKRFLEEVSVEHGYGGDINEEVLDIARRELEKMKPPPVFKHCTIRGDRRVELACNHGCGHPSYKLTMLHRGSWRKTDAVHGCDGCCAADEFEEAEERFSGQFRKK